MLKFLKLLPLLFIISFVSAGCLGSPRDGASTTTYQKAAKSLNQASAIKYEGEEGRTALEILKEKYQVQTKSFSGVGEYVESINSVKPDNKHFWAFYVNGKFSNLGAGDYKTKNGDQVEWKLEEIK